MRNPVPTPDIVFTHCDAQRLASALDRITTALGAARLEAGSLAGRFLRPLRSVAFDFEHPVDTTAMRRSRSRRLGQSILSIRAHANGCERIDFEKRTSRKGRHLHELRLTDAGIAVWIEHHGPIDGVRAKRFGSADADAIILDMARAAIEGAIRRRLPDPSDLSHAAASRLKATDGSEPTMYLGSPASPHSIVTPAVDLAWPTPISPARVGIVDRDTDVWSLNPPIAVDLPTAWELDVMTPGDGIEIHVRQPVMRLPRPVDPMGVLRGEAAFAAAA